MSFLFWVIYTTTDGHLGANMFGINMIKEQIKPQKVLYIPQKLVNFGPQKSEVKLPIFIHPLQVPHGAHCGQQISTVPRCSTCSHRV